MSGHGLGRRVRVYRPNQEKNMRGRSQFNLLRLFHEFDFSPRAEIPALRHLFKPFFFYLFGSIFHACFVRASAMLQWVVPPHNKIISCHLISFLPSYLCSSNQFRRHAAGVHVAAGGHWLQPLFATDPVSLLLAEVGLALGRAGSGSRVEAHQEERRTAAGYRN